MLLVFNWQLFQKDEEGMGDKHAFYFNPKEGLIPRSLLRNKLMMNEVSLGLIPRSLLRGVSLEYLLGMK